MAFQEWDYGLLDYDLSLIYDQFNFSHATGLYMRCDIELIAGYRRLWCASHQPKSW